MKEKDEMHLISGYSELVMGLFAAENRGFVMILFAARLHHHEQVTAPTSPNASRASFHYHAFHLPGLVAVQDVVVTYKV